MRELLEYGLATYLVIGAWASLNCAVTGYTLATHRRLAWWRSGRPHRQTAFLLFATAVVTPVMFALWPVLLLVRPRDLFVWPSVDLIERAARGKR